MCREYLFMRSVFVFLFMSVFAFVHCELYCLFLHVCLCKCAHKCVVISCSEEHLNILLSLRFLIYLVPISYFFFFLSIFLLSYFLPLTTFSPPRSSAIPSPLPLPVRCPGNNQVCLSRPAAPSCAPVGRVASSRGVTQALATELLIENIM